MFKFRAVKLCIISVQLFEFSLLSFPRFRQFNFKISYKFNFSEIRYVGIPSTYCRQRFGACRRRGFLAQKFYKITNLEPCTNAQSKNFSPAFGKPLLCDCAFISTIFPFLFFVQFLYLFQFLRTTITYNISILYQNIWGLAKILQLQYLNRHFLEFYNPQSCIF